MSSDLNRITSLILCCVQTPSFSDVVMTFAVIAEQEYAVSFFITHEVNHAEVSLLGRVGLGSILPRSETVAMKSYVGIIHEPV